MRAAQNVTGLDIKIPPQPPWSSLFVDAYETQNFGAKLVTLASIDMLKFIIMNEWNTALILEDDADWDIHIKSQMLRLANGISIVVGNKNDYHSPYGTSWDILWLGHCRHPHTDVESVIYHDNDTLATEFLDPETAEYIIQGERQIQRFTSAVCTFGYAVTNKGARKLLDVYATGIDNPTDLILEEACANQTLHCIIVHPTIIGMYEPQEAETSEVRAGNDHKEVNTNVTLMGHTKNVLNSARCKAIFDTTCYIF